MSRILPRSLAAAALAVCLVPAGAVGAQPAGADDTDLVDPVIPGCAIRLHRVPAALRAGLAESLRDRASCAARLDVWIVESPGGLYVLAIDPQHRVHERVVDAAALASLIAAWSEDAVDAPLLGLGPIRDGEQVALAPGQIDAPAARPRTVDAPPTRGLSATAVVLDAPREAEQGQGMTLAALGTTSPGGMQGAGVRVLVDLGLSRSWRIAAGASLQRDIASTFYVVNSAATLEEIGRTDTDVVVGLHRRWGSDGFHLRPEFTAGLGVARHELLGVGAGGVTGGSRISDETTVGVRAQGLLLLGSELAPGIAAEAGLGYRVTVFDEVVPGRTAQHFVVATLGLRYQR
ncbi:MAG: hypothetical protein KBG28_24030 [Kofleriaceae bacterium]|nr:hypothetical protein [Kofleriaceae bacterium]MBP9207059.1 hypothetical protein [Kofleriaceae bacterium]